MSGNPTTSVVFFLVDLLLLILSGFLFGRLGSIPLFVQISCGILFMGVLVGFGAYLPSWPLPNAGLSGKFFRGLALALVVVSGSLYMTGFNDPDIRFWFLRVGMLSGFLLVLARLSLYRLITRVPAIVRTSTCRVAIFGAGTEGVRLRERLLADPQSRFEVVGIFDERQAPNRKHMSNFKLSGDLQALLEWERTQGLDAIILALPGHVVNTQRFSDIVSRLRVLPVDLCLSLDQSLPWIYRAEFQTINGIELLRITKTPLGPIAARLKRVVDVGLIILTLPILLPIMGVIALLIVVDSPGPVFYCQKRRGFDCQVFSIYKFRSMYQHQEEHMIQARPGDPRITRVGRWLRRTSLDELPQVINVLLGDMSIVGPRPHAVEMDDEYARLFSRYLCRLRVRPGITGLAQIRGARGLTDTPDKMQSRLRHDLEYAEAPGFLTDILIMVRTLKVVIFGKNAC